MTSKKRTVELPTVAGRLEITSIRDHVDQELERLGHRSLDLSNDQTREQFREWLASVLQGYLHALAWDVSKGADRGIRQVLAIAEDPDYYAKASARRKQRQAAMRRDVSISISVLPSRTLAKGVELPRTEFGVYHRDSTEESGFDVTLIGAANSLEEAERLVLQKFGPRSLGQRMHANGADKVEIVRISDMAILKEWTVG